MYIQPQPRHSTSPSLGPFRKLFVGRDMYTYPNHCLVDHDAVAGVEISVVINVGDGFQILV